MRTTVLRTLCTLLWGIAALLGYWAWMQGNWRDVIGQVSLALFALVLWLALPPGASRLQTPTIGSRSGRRVLYTALLLAALVATTRWPAGLDDGAGSDSAIVLMLAGIVTGPFLEAERRRMPIP